MEEVHALGIERHGETKYGFYEKQGLTERPDRRLPFAKPDGY
jgi:hypothetical protein